MAFVRVLLPNGWEATFTTELAQSAGLTIINKPATNRWGRPLPATPSTEPTPTPTPSEVDVDVWSGDGPPPLIPPQGCDPDDLWIDLVSGDVYKLNQE